MVLSLTTLPSPPIKLLLICSSFFTGKEDLEIEQRRSYPINGRGQRLRRPFLQRQAGGGGRIVSVPAEERRQRRQEAGRRRGRGPPGRGVLLRQVRDFEDKPAGQYIEKAEGYLKEYSSGPAAGAEKPAGDAPAAPAPAGDVDDAPKPAEPAPAPAAAEESKSEGFGLDDVVNGAEQLVEKQGGGGESAGGGAGGLFNMAKGFLK